MGNMVWLWTKGTMQTGTGRVTTQSKNYWRKIVIQRTRKVQHLVPPTCLWLAVTCWARCNHILTSTREDGVKHSQMTLWWLEVTHSMVCPSAYCTHPNFHTATHTTIVMNTADAPSHQASPQAWFTPPYSCPLLLMAIPDNAVNTLAGRLAAPLCPAQAHSKRRLPSLPIGTCAEDRTMTLGRIQARPSSRKSTRSGSKTVIRTVLGARRQQVLRRHFWRNKGMMEWKGRKSVAVYVYHAHLLHVTSQCLLKSLLMVTI